MGFPRSRWQRRKFRRLRLVAVAWPVLLLFAACSNPVVRLAANERLDSLVLQGKPFTHQLFVNDQAVNTAPDGSEPLHIYLDGDGRPWRTPTQISLDPTPTNPLLLKLMLLDPAPAVYIGRPCYFSLDDKNCAPIWWTMRRYAPEVVESINSVIDQQIKTRQKIVLIGYSGGGTLAMLVAKLRNDVAAVVTVAANLDTERWNEYHNYSQLAGSLNPASESPLPASIRQLHLFGGQDDNTPQFLAERTLSQQTNSRVKSYADFTHSCCWTTIWPDVLEMINKDF